MDLKQYIRRNYKMSNPFILKDLGASEELIEYLTNTPWNTNMKVVESLISGEGGDEKQGIKSITISPALDATPALDSLFPVYYDESSAEEGWYSFKQTLAANAITEGTEYSITITPTSGWLAGKAGVTPVGGETPGEPCTYVVTAANGLLSLGEAWVGSDDNKMGIDINIEFKTQK